MASQWDLMCSQSWMLHLANSGFFLGALGGLVLFQQVAEELGEQSPHQTSPLTLHSLKDLPDTVHRSVQFSAVSMQEKVLQQECSSLQGLWV